MKANLQVGDRVRRIEGDTEVGTITMIDGDDAFVDFERFDRIIQCCIKVHRLKRVRVQAWEACENRISRSWLGIDGGIGA